MKVTCYFLEVKFIHAGSSYINSNVRLHFYIEPKWLVGRPEDKTYFFYSDEPRYNRTKYMKEKGKLNLITHRINMQRQKTQTVRFGAPGFAKETNSATSFKKKKTMLNYLCDD